MSKEDKLIGQKFNHGVVIEFLGADRKRKRNGLLWKLECLCGNTYEATTTDLTCDRKKSCGCHRKHARLKRLQNTVGRRYGKLVVVDTTEDRNSSGVLYRRCKCDCGNYKHVTQSNLTSGNVTSCGCNKNLQGKQHKLYRGYEDISLRYWSRIQNNARNRGLDFSITIEYAWGVWKEQNRLCALSGQSLCFQRSKSSNFTASLDRIDNSKGYVEGNIQWIHKDINKCKTDFSQDYFLAMCKMVADNQ